MSIVIVVAKILVPQLLWWHNNETELLPSRFSFPPKSLLWHDGLLRRVSITLYLLLLLLSSLNFTNDRRVRSLSVRSISQYWRRTIVVVGRHYLFPFFQSHTFSTIRITTMTRLTSLVGVVIIVFLVTVMMCCPTWAWTGGSSSSKVSRYRRRSSSSSGGLRQSRSRRTTCLVGQCVFLFTSHTSTKLCSHYLRFDTEYLDIA